jgi:N-acetylglucosaminyldiphosphoundecaprenol N-acetyl-beta-D-mannosaminyltransferase
MRVKLLDIPIDKVTLEEASDRIGGWVENKTQNYVVTPNVEMIVRAQEDQAFKQALTDSGLAIPDSSRIGWGLKMQDSGFLHRLFYWPFFLAPNLLSSYNFPVTTGTDLMEKLLDMSQEKAFRVGLLGGEKNVAIRLAERLQARYKKLRIVYIQENLKVDKDGNHQFFEMQNLIGFKQNQAISNAKAEDFYQNLNSHELDLLFVAFGHVKQEKWMQKNSKKINVPVMLGVGGAFDYLSGQVTRAPQWLRSLGFEWLYRLILQPWRIFRFGALVKFVFLVLLKSKNS